MLNVLKFVRKESESEKIGLKEKNKFALKVKVFSNNIVV